MRIDSLRLDGAWTRRLIEERPSDPAAGPVEQVEVPDSSLWSFHRMADAEKRCCFTRQIDCSFLPKNARFRVFLSIPGTCSLTEILLNGQRILEPLEYQFTFRREITRFLSPAATAARLDIIVHPGGICRGTPELEIIPVPGISAVMIQPDPVRKRAAVAVITEGPAEELEVQLQVPETDLSITRPPGVFELSLPTAPQWTPSQPVLLTLNVTLRSKDGRVIDRVIKRWGMRDFTVQERRFHLNGHPIFLRAATIYQENLSPPETTDPKTWLRTLVLTAREIGLNALWIRNGQAPRDLLDTCDEAGLCVFEEWPAFLVCHHTDKATTNGFSPEDVIRAKQHHPSLCGWTLSAAKATDTDVLLTSLRNTALTLRKQDPSQLILAGFDRSFPDRFLVKPYQTAELPLEIIRFDVPSPLCRDEERRLSLAGGQDTLNLVWLLSPGFAAPTAAEDAAIHQMLTLSFRGEGGPDAVRRQLQQDFLTRAVDAITLNPKVTGYVLDPFVESDCAPGIGLLDRQGNALPAAGMLQHVQGPLRPIVHLEQTNLTLRQESGLQIFMSNWDRDESRAEIQLLIQGPSGQFLWKKQRGIRFLPKHRQLVWEGVISASGKPGTHYLQIDILRQNQPTVTSRYPFYVTAQAGRFEGRIHILDRNGRYTEAIRKVAAPGTLLSPIHVIPPLSNALAGYPDNALAQVLAQVRGGAVALMFSPPVDWDNLAAQADIPELGMPYAFHDDLGRDMALFCPMIHPAFDGFGGGSQVLYMLRNLLPRQVYRTVSIEQILTCYAPVRTGAASTWTEFHAIVVKQLGAGLIACIPMPLLEHLGLDPAADRLFVNLLSHFSRRSVPPDRPLPPESRVVEWIRQAAEQRARFWRFIGPFPNWTGKGIQEVYPPEQELQFNGIYPGSHLPVMWHSRCVPAGTITRLNFSEAIGISRAQEDWDRFTAYAWAEIETKKAGSAILEGRSPWPFLIWINGTPVIAQPEPAFSQGTPSWHTAEITLRTGRNNLLVKAAKTAGPALFVDLRLNAPESQKLEFLPPQ